jgi:hypothetical protein
VSDLDGTMVGEGEEADACTRDFAAYWEDNAALAGGVLVYNTGRSLGQFQGLLEWKAGALPVPDVLITAVGTKVWRLDAAGGTRGTATGLAWQEDLQWARTLDEGWSLPSMRQCVQRVLDAHQGATSWLVSRRCACRPAAAAARRHRVGAAPAPPSSPAPAACWPSPEPPPPSPTAPERRTTAASTPTACASPAAPT